MRHRGQSQLSMIALFIYFCEWAGVVILDLDATDLPSIANYVVDELVLSGQLPGDSRGHVLKALLLKHRYVTPVNN